MALKIGQLSYISGLPISYVFAHGLLGDVPVEGVTAYPDELDRMMANGELAAAPISSLEYMRHDDRYALIPDISIGSWGRIGSSILFGREPFNKLGGQTVALPRHGATSNALARWLIGRLYGVEANFVEADGSLEELLAQYPAALLIGDQAILEARKPGEVALRLDLGEAWWQAMHVPFVHTLWACQADLPREQRQQIAELLMCAKELSKTHHAAIVAEASTRLGIPAEEAEAYFALLNYDFTPVHRQGLAMFGDYLEEMSLLA
jgi:chorismate dehydratase